MEGSSSSLNSHGGYSWSWRATGSGLSLKMETPFRRVPGGAADGRDCASEGVEGVAEEEATAEPDAKVRAEDADRIKEHEARIIVVVALIVGATCMLPDGNEA